MSDIKLISLSILIGGKFHVIINLLIPPLITEQGYYGYYNIALKRGE